MSFVLDNSVTMRWFLGDGKPQELRFARRVLDVMKNASALVPVTWGLEVANVIAKAEAKGLNRGSKRSISRDAARPGY
ncbi:MAG: type II toxin-antitoxin system VapC family toxin [Gammaproteobacteria bacterium]